MTTHTAGMPRPLPSSRRVDGLDDPFWMACARGEFLLQMCGSCGRHYWPASSCVDHGPVAMRWVQASGRGVVHSFVDVLRTNDPAFRERVPYNVVVVRLDEQVLFHSAVPAPPAEGLHIGQRVEAVFDQIGPGEALPVFRVRDAHSPSSTRPSPGGSPDGQH